MADDRQVIYLRVPIAVKHRLAALVPLMEADPRSTVYRTGQASQNAVTLELLLDGIEARERRYKLDPTATSTTEEHPPE